MRLITLIALLIIGCQGICQNVIYRGTKSFPSTRTWTFDIPMNGQMATDLDLSIGRNNTTGILLMSVDVAFNFEAISGTCMLYLTNGKTVVLTNKTVNDHVDRSSKVLYPVTATQIQLLKDADIVKVRFSIRTSKVYGGRVENYTATNPEVTEEVELVPGGPRLQQKAGLQNKTANEISDLFN